MSKKVIGLVGSNKTGKNEFVKFLKNNYAHIITVHTFSEILGEILNIIYQERSRDNLQDLATLLRSRFGNGVLVESVRKKIEKDRVSTWIIIDGIRMWEEVEMLKSLGGVLIYITAPVRMRWKWARLASDKIGDEDLTFRKFEEQEKRPTEILIPEIGKTADFEIRNDEEIPELYVQFKEIIQKILKNT